MTVWYPAPTDVSTIQPLYFRLRNHCRKGDKWIVRAKGPDVCWETVPSIYNREAAPIKMVLKQDLNNGNAS